MVIYLYRWRLKPEKVEQFIVAWSFITEQLLECKSFGSRLHEGSDGLYYGYAQWPDRATREKANPLGNKIQEAQAMMREATLEILPPIILDPIKDYLVSPGNKTSTGSLLP